MTTATKPTDTDKDANRQHWLTLIKQWEESKLSQQAYCTKLGINLNSFTYWRGKFLSSASREVKAKFVRVKTAANHAAAADKLSFSPVILFSALQRLTHLPKVDRPILFSFAISATV